MIGDDMPELTHVFLIFNMYLNTGTGEIQRHLCNELSVYILL